MSNSLVCWAKYSSKQALREACEEEARRRLFKFITIRSNANVYTVKCTADRCPWRLYARRAEGPNIWEIKTLRVHSCQGHNPTVDCSEPFQTNQSSPPFKCPLCKVQSSRMQNWKKYSLSVPILTVVKTLEGPAQGSNSKG